MRPKLSPQEDVKVGELVEELMADPPPSLAKRARTTTGCTEICGCRQARLLIPTNAPSRTTGPSLIGAAKFGRKTRTPPPKTPALEEDGEVAIHIC